MKRGLAIGVAALSLLGLAGPAEAARPEIAFDGRCDVYGDVIFRDRVTTAVTENPFVFRTADRLTTCAGTVRVGQKTLLSKTRPFRVVVGGTGQVSCQNSTADGLSGRLILLKRKQGNVFKPRRINGRRVQIRTTISLEHVLNSVVAQIAGAAGSSAVARATFFPTPEAIQRCGEDGIRTLPFNGTVVTDGELVSE